MGCIAIFCLEEGGQSKQKTIEQYGAIKNAVICNTRSLKTACLTF